MNLTKTWIGLMAVLAFVGALALATTEAAAQARESNLVRVTKSKKLRVCIWPEYYAISHKNPTTGKLQGIDIDVAQALGKELGAEVQFVETSFGAFIADMQADKCDICMFGLGATLPRARAVEFSEPYIVTSIYGVTRKDHPKIKKWADLDQDGLVVAVALGSYVETFMKGYLKKAKVLSVQPPATREGEVAARRADILMTDYPIAKKLESLHDWALIVAPTEPLAVTPYAYAIPQGDQVWLNYINLFVQTLKRDGRLLEYAKKNGLEPVVHLK
ncbi:MAG: amino acid ABC transporter substrate-binding protein [Acidimicrobiia bacterium]|nr:amino acid ABC transporter substrate-binding protein [Acidimicrobiia bacterium]